MTHTTTKTGLMAAALILASGGAASAKVPDVLDRVDLDAPVIIVIDEVDGFIDDAEMIINMTDNTDPGVTMGIAMLRGMRGLDRSGSAAMVLLELPEDDSEEPDFVFVLPIDDLKAVTGGAKGDDGVVPFSFGEGEDELFLRDIGGGFAVAGPDWDLVHDYDGADGQMKSHGLRLGKNGRRLTKNSELTVIADIESLAPFMREGLGEMQQQAMMMSAMTGQDGEDVAASMGVFNTLAESFINDARVGLFGLSIDETGISIDFGSQFDEGSELAGYFNNAPGQASSMLGRVPNMDYYFAFAGDYTGEGMTNLAVKLGELTADLPSNKAFMGQMNFAEIMKNTDGQAVVVGASSGGMAGGLFQNIITYTKSSDAGALIETAREMMEGMNGQVQNGIKFTTEFGDGEEDIAGAKITTYAMQMTADGEGGQGIGQGMMDPTMMMSMMFGPGMGPNGYFAQLNSGTVQTMSRNKELLTTAINAARAGDGLSTNALIAQVARHLPEGRSFEGYISPDGILNTAGPMMMMFGMLEEFEPMDELAPIGFGGTTIDGGVIGRVYLPLETITTIAEMFPQDEGFDEMDGDGGEDGMGGKDDGDLDF